jgi:hypothetical protein
MATKSVFPTYYGFRQHIQMFTQWLKATSKSVSSKLNSPSSLANSASSDVPHYKTKALPAAQTSNLWDILLILLLPHIQLSSPIFISFFVFCKLEFEFSAYTLNHSTSPFL